MTIYNSDGSVVYMPDDVNQHLSDVFLNGTSVWELGVQEVKVKPDGYGYVLLEKRLPTDTVTKHNQIVDGTPMIDGQVLTLIYEGLVSVEENP